ncbi:unnamed protein product [Aureobasidium vineae]|uniref:Uncharacterized protein n=1 Tax=Aureobasidium vineae TaxID=2773715 RepID=A0A9N8J7J2_9PEZI|nr:unnamed protein product [Aureobasidium vineae]
MPPKRAATKRQYSAVDVESDADSSTLEGTAHAAPKRKTSTTTKPTATKKGPAAKGLTTSLKHLKPVQVLEKMDGGLVAAFNLTMYIADASHTACDTTSKMSGYGDSEAPFAELDEQLLDLIEKRNTRSPATRQDGLPAVPKRWTRADADVGVFETGRPNKQQYGQMERQKLEWEEDRREKRRERRETVNNCAAAALQDLEEERDYFEQYGVEKYFPKSIVRLKGLSRSEDMITAGGDAAWIQTSLSYYTNPQYFFPVSFFDFYISRLFPGLPIFSFIPVFNFFTSFTTNAFASSSIQTSSAVFTSLAISLSLEQSITLSR